MQKTVDINENCLFLKDLEMLRAAPEEPLPSLDERSPDQSPNCLGSFKLQGSNPLEQLGLYMKMDDEEEEEVEPQCIPGPGNDVEEGEIDWLAFLHALTPVFMSVCQKTLKPKKGMNFSFPYACFPFGLHPFLLDMVWKPLKEVDMD